MTRTKWFVNVVLVYLLIFTSGSVLYNYSSDKYLVIAFVISLVAWVLFSEKKINEKFVLYACVFAGFQLAISIYTEGSQSLASVISITAKLVFGYLIIQTVGRSFTETFVLVVVVLATFSLLGYCIDYFGLLPALVSELPRVGGSGYEGILYLYGYHGAIIHRNSSIFFEPGAYQGFLNAALFILLFVQARFNAGRRWIFSLILVVALFTTFSTTGYLIFSIMFGLFLLRGEMLSASGKAILVGVLLACLTVFYAKFQTVVLVKMEDYLSGDERAHSLSADRRRFDAKVDLEIFKKHIFGVGYRKYYEEFNAIGHIAGGSSNGVTIVLALYGLPFSLFFFGSYFFAFRKLLGRGVIGIASLGMFLMFLMSESYYISAPISLAIIAAMFAYKDKPLEVGYSGEDEHSFRVNVNS